MVDASVQAQDRIHDRSSLDALIERTARSIGLGGVDNRSVIETGYEDCNIDVSTTAGRFVVKVFAANRSTEEIERYVNILEEVAGSGIAHPELVSGGTGDTLITDAESGNRLIVMRHFGQSFMDLGRLPSADELGLIAEQAARINSLSLRPSFQFDCWAVPNISVLASEVEAYLSDEDRDLTGIATRLVAQANQAKLPYAFVHGDLSKANALVSDAGNVAIIDFSVANVYPRIQELAVMAANLMHDDATSLGSQVDIVADAYSQHDRISDSEREALHAYAVGAAAMELLGATKELHLSGNDRAENAYWLELGRNGLRSACRELGFQV